MNCDICTKPATNHLCDDCSGDYGREVDRWRSAEEQLTAANQRILDLERRLRDSNDEIKKRGKEIAAESQPFHP
jgi:predicted metal-dependent hydrolase